MKQLLFVILWSFSLNCFSQNTQEEMLLKDELGNTYTFQSILNNGRNKVFVFWAGYCVPCKYEMKGLTNLSSNWLEDYNAEVYFVALRKWDSKVYDGLKFTERFNNKGQYKFFDPERKLYSFFNGSAFPTTILIDRDKNVVQKWSNYDDGLERSIGMYFEKLHQAQTEQEKKPEHSVILK